MKKTFKIIYRNISSSFKKPPIRNSFFLLLGIIIVATVLLSFNVIGSTYDYNLGDISHEDIKVSGDIHYAIDSETDMEKKRVAEMVPLVFDKDQLVLIERLKLVEALFGRIHETLQENPPIGTDDRTFQLVALKARLPKYLLYNDATLLEILKHNHPKELRKVINRVLIYLFDRGLMEKTYGNPLRIKNKNVSIRTINVSEETDEISTTLENIYTIHDVKKDLYKVCYSIAPNLNKDQLRAVYNIVNRNIRPNLRFNAEESKRRISESVKSVKPIMGLLKKGQTIVREGDTITTESLKKIQILNKYTSTTNINYIIGVFILQFSFLIIFGYFMVIYNENISLDNKTSLILFTLLVFFIFYTFFISRIENIQSSKLIFTLFLPIPFVTMIVAILYNVYLSLMVGIYLIFFSYGISNASFASLILAFSSALGGAFVVGDVEKRTEFLRGGFILGLFNSLIVISVGLMEELSLAHVINNVELSFGNGLINAILALGFIPLYENLFGYTTKFKLLELSDLNASIFKRMLIRAPGTYNHSLMVANMAEAACKDIGANSMMARVGGYYHDIGKIENAGIYIENKINDERTKYLSPKEYTQLIISHVEKGVKLAKKNSLPDSITDFIREHHGNSTMTYFYHQALELVNNSEEADELHKSDFQYPGPRPQTRESAVVMLADSVEAAARSLQEPTYVKLEGLVKKITYNKLNEGELEFSDLTMSDLNKIQKSFLRVLYGIFHTRIEYPERDELEKLEDQVLLKKNHGS